MTGKPTDDIESLAGIGRYIFGGLFVIVFVVGGIGLWAAKTEIAGAVLAPGTVVVESNVKKVQHPTGGVVGEIRVKEGETVKAGDLLVRLDETVTRANLQMISNQLDELTARAARLEAERDDVEAVRTPEALASRLNETDLAKIIAGEQGLFKTRRESRESQKAQLRERIDQLGEEIAGVSGQITAKTTEIELISKQLGSLEKLEVQNLVTASKMAEIRREAARLKGEFGRLRSDAAQAKGKIAEVELQILRVDQDAKSDVVKDLQQTQSKLSELGERRIAAEDQLKRVEIRAPQSGKVHQLAVHTVGGVVNPGEPIMLIVPEDDHLMVETRIAPQSIDQVHLDQTALIRFVSFNQRTTPELVGKVTRIAADLSRDPQTGESYFSGRLDISEEELKRLGGQKLVPGMPADIQFRTVDRTVLSYLLKPVEDQFSKAFRER